MKLYNANVTTLIIIPKMVQFSMIHVVGQKTKLFNYKIPTN